MSARRPGDPAPPTSLTEQFVASAPDNGCAEGHVDSYVANERAQRIYERHGFAALNVTPGTQPLVWRRRPAIDR